MNFSMQKICTYFNCFDTDKKCIESNVQTRKILGKLGLFPEKVNVFAVLRIFAFCTYFSLMAFGQIGHLCHFLSNNPFSFYAVADDIGVMLTTACISFLFFLAGLQAPRIQQVFDSLYQVESDIGKTPGIEALEYFATKFANCLVAAFTCTGLISFVLYYLQHCEPGEMSACGFIFEPYLPYVDLFNAPGRQIFLMCQCLSSYTGGCAILLFILQTVHINEVIILHILHMKMLIRKIFVLESRAKRKHQIKLLVRSHYLLLVANAEFNVIFKYAFICHIIITPLSLSIILYQLLGREIMLSSIVHLISYIITIVSNCTSAERLKNESEKLADAIYNGITCDGDTQTQRDMILILQRCQKPLMANIGEFGFLGHVLLINVYKSVFSTLTVLQQMN